jgi:beta-glucosidase
VASYAGPLVEGLQGKIGAKDRLKGSHIVATAKHFVGDGGTNNDKDQGDNLSTEAALRDVQAAGYRPVLAAGVQVVMASYNSWHGEKMHGNASLLTGVLKGRMNIGGFIVGDWNGHGQVKGCNTTCCAPSMNAGLDGFMAPDSWKTLYHATLAQAKDGADSDMKQSGGWTLSWQGTNLSREDFPRTTTIGAALVAAGNGKAVLNADGHYSEKA